MRDKYLHTNCLAALANMSGQFRALHPYVAQRLVSLFETLAKKHARLDQLLKQPLNGGNASSGTAAASMGGGPTSIANAVTDEVIEISDPAMADDMVGGLLPMPV